MSVAGDTLQLLALSLSSHVRLSLVLRLFPPGSYINLLLLLVPKLLGLRKWSWTLLMWMVSLVQSLHAGLSSMSSG